MDKKIQSLGNKAINLLGNNPSELERSCWMIVHEHIHGVKPSEYDIREIDEDLYLLLLDYVRKNINKK